MSDGVMFTERELVDLALNFANGQLVEICKIFSIAYLRDRPEIANALKQGADGKAAAIEQLETALNAFLGAESNGIVMLQSVDGKS